MAYKIPKASSSIPTNSVTNLGITYSSSTFSVTSADGTALSAGNPGTVIINSAATPGLVVAVSVTANQTFIDDSGASTIVGNTFGFGAAETMASNDVPFYLYAVIDDARSAVAFGISRMPAMLVAPSSAVIGKTGSAVATTNGSLFLLGNPTVADYEQNPCIMIGSFNMKLTSAGDWTVTALDNYVGIGRFQERRSFDLGTAVFGAAAGSYFRSNGGTAPIWTTQAYSYCIMPHDAMMKVYVQLTGASTGGAGAVAALLVLPLGTVNMGGVAGRMTGGNIGGTIVDVIVEEASSGDDIQFIDTTTYSTVSNLAIFAANPSVRVNVTYPIFI